MADPVARPVSLVTGAAGFIGSYLCEALVAHGHRVIGVDAFTDAYDVGQKRANVAGLATLPEFDLVEGHLTTLGLGPLLRHADYVFHLAARARVLDGWEPETFDTYLTDNCRSTQRLADAALAADVKLFSFASTSSVYGSNPAIPTPEDHPVQPTSFYALTKVMDEHLLRAYHRLFGLPVVILRYYSLFGPRQPPDMLAHVALRAIATGQQLTIYGDGAQTRELTYVRDAVTAQLRLVDRLPIGETFNIGSGPHLTVSDYVREMERVVGRPADIVHVERNPADLRHTQADISKARRILGFEPNTTVRAGLEAEYAWMRESVLASAPTAH